MTERVFATCDIGGEALERLRTEGYQLEVYPGPEAPPKSLILEKVRSGIEGLITTLRDPIDAEVLAAGKGTLRAVCQASVGFDNIDRTAANHNKIPFANTPGVLTEATAEFAFFMMGSVARKLWPSERLVRENRWGAWHPYLPFLGDEVTGKTIAIIGTGRIGRAMIRKCLGFEMDILCYSSSRRPEFARAIQSVMDLQYKQGLQKRKTTIRFVALDEALVEADFVSIHVPMVRPGEASAPTYHLFNRETLRRMKPTAYLINTARGPVVDEAALYEALRERWIAGAALDVFEEEPLPADSPLRDPDIEDRCRLFHHFASGAQATRLSPDPEVGIAGRAVQNLIELLSGQDPAKVECVVNKEAF